MYKMLTSSLKVGSHLLKNRMIKSPQQTNFFSEDQSVSQTAIDFYKSLAAGGVGMIICGAIQFVPQHFGHLASSLCDDRFIAGFKILTDAVHAHDCLIIAQFNQDGASDRVDPKCASAFTEDELPCPTQYCNPCNSLTLEEISHLKEQLIAAAVRAKSAGFDGVEVHSANAYFLLSFLSRVWNKRTDQYGPQNMENRTRLQREIISEIRNRCGQDFIIGIRINGQEFGHPRAMTIAEGVEAAQWMEKGGVDYISVTGYGYGPIPMQYVPDYWAYPQPDPDMEPFKSNFKTGLLVPAAAAIKKAVSVPVFVAGRLDENIGEKILEEGKADAVLFGRALWADHELPNKITENRLSDIVHCTRCATCEDPQDGAPRRCRVNPAFGRERELTITPIADPKSAKKVVIVGGGPAGMEAARVASLRGHSVILYEKNSYLGGKLPLATMIKGTDFENIPSITDYLTEQLHKSSVKIHLKTEVSEEILLQEKPDVIILATGGQYQLPQNLPGIHNSNVSGVVSLSKIAELPLKLFGPKAINKLSEYILPGIGKNIIILGGQIEGLQAALFLKKRGKQVTILEENNYTGKRIPPRYLRRTNAWLEQQGVKILTNVTYQEITKRGISIINANHVEEFIEGDIMVLQSPQENTTLIDAAKQITAQVYRIGAANGTEHSLMVHAIKEGREIGCKL